MKDRTKTIKEIIKNPLLQDFVLSLPFELSEYRGFDLTVVPIQFYWEKDLEERGAVLPISATVDFDDDETDYMEYVQGFNELSKIDFALSRNVGQYREVENNMDIGHFDINYKVPITQSDLRKLRQGIVEVYSILDGRLRSELTPEEYRRIRDILAKGEINESEK